MGRERREAEREALRLHARPGVQRLGIGRIERARIAADLVQRDQAVPAVERRVLDALGHDGPADLLEADDQVAAGVARGQVSRSSGSSTSSASARSGREWRAAADHALEPLDLGLRGRKPGPQVRAVHLDVGQQLAQGFLGHGGVELGPRRPRRPSPPRGPAAAARARRGCARRGSWPRSRPARATARRPPRASARRAPARPGARARPAARASRRSRSCRRTATRPGAARRAQGCPRPPPMRPPVRVGQALEVALRIGESVGVVDTEAVDHALVVELEQHGVRGVEDVVELDADRDQRVDVEEAPVVEHLVLLAPARERVVLALEHRRDVAAGAPRREREGVVGVAHDGLAGLLARAQARRLPAPRRAPRRAAAGRCGPPPCSQSTSNQWANADSRPSRSGVPERSVEVLGRRAPPCGSGRRRRRARGRARGPSSASAVRPARPPRSSETRVWSTTS